MLSRVEMLWDFPKKARDDFASLNKAENLQEGLFAIELFILVQSLPTQHPSAASARSYGSGQALYSHALLI